MRALIFAAGLGTRLKPITETIPKALVEVGGKPLLGHLIAKLKSAGFTEIVVNVHHFAGKVIEYLRNNDFGANISISLEESQPLETGGGIKHAAKFLDNGEPFLAHNVDILSNLNLQAFMEAHKDAATPPLATLLVSNRKTSRYFVFDSNNLLCGWVNMESGLFKSPYEQLKEAFAHSTGISADLGRPAVEAPLLQERIDEFLESRSLKRYAFAGTHIISPEVFQLMQEWPERFPIVDFYLANASRYQIKGYIDHNLTLIDVGRPEHLPIAEEFLKKEFTSATPEVEIK